MALRPEILQRVQQLLAAGEGGGASTTRLMAEGARLWHRVQRLAEMNLIRPESNREAMELACYAYQLPLRTMKSAGARTPALGLRERAEQAAELLVSGLGGFADELAETAGKMLRELTRRAPHLAEARLLADALNLEEFGISGLIAQAMQIARNGGSLQAAAEGLGKRQAYGYWDALLKDHFHFEPVRQIAIQRLEAARQTISQLAAEMREDHAL